ncbi:hypothetical protein PYW08_008525 [Mythimna loreyi]|uniref:Uncharacterized protein n=1 Tax=Mythimna loreyi TaxID=667449 RepID=A0ACC2Q9C0_9NEOP|nr:hypothetical protein PYW08_008525 [Mythimna loreyi]
MNGWTNFAKSFVIVYYFRTTHVFVLPLCPVTRHIITNSLFFSNLSSTQSINLFFGLPLPLQHAFYPSSSHDYTKTNAFLSMIQSLEPPIFHTELAAVKVLLSVFDIRCRPR